LRVEIVRVRRDPAFEIRPRIGVAPGLDQLSCLAGALVRFRDLPESRPEAAQ
jgi:hypothetical protein